MQKKNIGKVSEQERDEIKSLFERKNGLTELFKIIDSNNAQLYEKVVKDMGETSTKFQKWWDDNSKKYKWIAKEDSHWEIDFETCIIYLAKNQ
jgi:CXXX repeat modification system protein